MLLLFVVMVQFVNGEFTEIMTAQTAHLGSGGGASAHDYHDQHLDSVRRELAMQLLFVCLLVCLLF